MNASKTISKDYAKWFDDLVKAFVDAERTPWQPLENYLQWNALYVTFLFDKRAIGRRKSAQSGSSVTNPDSRQRDQLDRSELSPEFWNVEWLYKRMCRAILGRNFHKHRDKQPLVIACADVNGTRNGAPTQVKNLHIHSLWVFRKGQINAFQNAIESVKADPSLNLNDFADIDVRDVDSMKLDGNQPSHLSSYCAKFLGHNARNMIVGQDLAIFPIVPQKAGEWASANNRSHRSEKGLYECTSA